MLIKLKSIVLCFLTLIFQCCKSQIGYVLFALFFSIFVEFETCLHIHSKCALCSITAHNISVLVTSLTVVKMCIIYVYYRLQ